MDDAERQRLGELFARHQRIALAWEALQELYGLYLAEDRDGALGALDRFCDLYATGEIPEFGEVVDAILAWSGEILAFHEPRAHRASNGRLEGTIIWSDHGRVSDVADGFCRQDHFEARGILICGPVRSSPQPSPVTVSP